MASNVSDICKRNLKEPLVFILEDLDLTWTEEQINRAIFMWTAGWSIREMAKKLRQYDGILNAIDEVALLVMHLSRQNRIKPREGGVLGHE